MAYQLQHQISQEDPGLVSRTASTYRQPTVPAEENEISPFAIPPSVQFPLLEPDFGKTLQASNAQAFCKDWTA
jgi:hypothetical protein